MNGDTALPTIQFSSDASYDTLVSVLKDWCVRLWFDGTDVILVCRIVGPNAVEAPDGTWTDFVEVIGWSATAGDYITPLSVEVDSIRKVEIL